MLSALQPDRLADQTTDEVVEVFLGDTLEQAMAFAVAALGPDLTVRRARKIRRGVQGLVGKDRYEVVAVPGRSTAVPGDAVASAFDALLEQAEQQEAPRSRRTTRPPDDDRLPDPHPAPQVAQHDARVELLATTEPQPAAVPAARVPSDDVPTATPPAATPRTRTAAAGERAAKRPAASPRARAPRRTAAPSSGWSRRTLAQLGLPPKVLAALPATVPVDDLAWLGALTQALATVLPEPQPLSEAHALVVSGQGLDGVLGIIRAAALGLTPGTITSGGRTAPASPVELALVVRAAVVG